MATIPSLKKKPNKKNHNPETQFNYNLNFCSKSKDLDSAIALYNSAISSNIQLNQHHCNTLLYLCSISLSDASKKELALEYGFLVFEHMVANSIKRNEASITAVARLASAKGDGDYAFNLVKNMRVDNELPRLRTYDPVLFCFCEKLEASKAYEVEDHMVSMGVNLEEIEFAALMKVSVDTGNEERVYGYLQKLRKTVRSVKEETAKIIEDWFEGFEVNGRELDLSLVREAVTRNGGGWHGLGWIGKGKWVVKRGTVDMDGKCCCCCGENLACVDIDDLETERFAESLAGLAMEREVKANFREFQDWLERNANYEAIVDGANVGLYQQNFAEGGFSISQLDAVVKELYDQSGKWPLIVLHSKRVHALLANPSQRNLIQEWMRKEILYTAPHGSNDDWYWLYAAVKLRCLLVTNDEMRDHIFELLGSSFFLKWKERHQVRYTFVKGNLKLQMPPPFSVVIQESEKGSWHVPIAGDGNEDSAQSWLCITRPSLCDAPDKDAMNIENSENGHVYCDDTTLLSPCKSKCNPSCNNKLDSEDTFQQTESKPATLTGKRKERST